MDLLDQALQDSFSKLAVIMVYDIKRTKRRGADILEVKEQNKHIPLLLCNLPFHYVSAQTSGLLPGLARGCKVFPSQPAL